ncbi:hypothetical protein HRbin41_00847 [bacterium HR41]|nr:hypothetical protein HRbin41_00847 [bacterium HR41]
MLGSGAWVVEPRRYRVRLEHLAPFVVQHGLESAVQHAARAGGQRRRVATARDPLPCRLDADQLDRVVAEESSERADRVGATAHASNDTVRQPPEPLEHLRARFFPDHALQVAHERGIRGRTHRRADHVVGRLDVSDPVADRRANRLLERASARLDRLHLRPQKLHAFDVRPLAADVLAAHVDNALEAEQRACGSARHAVLTGPRFGDHAPLSHPQREQRLSAGVVDLVRTSVEQVLALQVDLATGRLREPASVVQRCRPTGVVAQQVAELGAKGRLVTQLGPRPLELVERGDQGLGHVAPAIGAEPPWRQRRRAGDTFAAAPDDTFAGARHRRPAFAPASGERPWGS